MFARLSALSLLLLALSPDVDRQAVGKTSG
jgi:hypothetical protein